MKYNPKTKSIKLEQGEIRVGNFFIKRELRTGHIKIQDLNSVFSFRVFVRMPIGVWLDNILTTYEKNETPESRESAEKTLRTYIAVLWSLFSVVPDDELVNVLVDQTHAAINRHPDWYGYNKTDDEAANAEAAQEVKEMAEFEKAAAEMPENPENEQKDAQPFPASE